MEYPFAEHATVWEGSATLTNERTGESVVVSGRRLLVRREGHPVRWDITSDRFVKHYLAIVEGMTLYAPQHAEGGTP